MQSSVVRQASGGLPIGTIAGAGERMTETTGSGETGRAASASGQAIFDRVMTQIKLRLGADVFNSWFGRMKLDDDAPSVARLSVPTAFLRSWINGHYLDLIAELWRKEEPRLLRLEIVVRSATRQVRTNEPVAVVEGRRPQKPQHAVPGSTVPLATLKTEKQASRPSNDGEPRQQSVRRSMRATRSSPSSKVRPTASPSPPPRRSRNQAPKRGALQSAVPACLGRARQDAPAAGDRRGGRCGATRRRASSI
jgi:hypothetical protein